MSESLMRAQEFTNQYISSVQNRIVSAIQSKSKAIIQEAASKFIPELQETLTNKFKDIVKDYYDDYSPEYYSRRGTMYNILKFNSDIKTATISWDFDPSEMPYSHGGGGAHDGGDTLFEKAFVGGWHGGAMSISGEKEAEYGTHPSPGTPYYRSPYPWFTKWGVPAKRSASPLDEFNKYWDTNHRFFEEMFQMYAQNEFEAKVPEIMRSLNL